MFCGICVTEFTPRTSQKYCSPECVRVARCRSAQKYRLAHPERVKELRIKLCTGPNREKLRAQERLRYRKNFAKNREKDNAYQRARYAADPSKWLKWSLKKVHWTVEEYQQKKEEQNFACAICETKESDLWRQLNADHNHDTNTPRGLLCGLCNTALERLDRVPGWADKAVQYLQRYAVDLRNNERVNLQS